jgi:hypothetical protein
MASVALIQGLLRLGAPTPIRLLSDESDSQSDPFLLPRQIIHLYHIPET